MGEVYCPHIVNYQWESFHLLSIKTWHCQSMFININTNSVFHGIAVWQGRLFLPGRIKGRFPKRSANSQNCRNTKQNNKGHHNQDIILGHQWQHPKQLWGWHNVRFISGELHFKRLQLLDERGDNKDNCCACVCCFLSGLTSHNKKGWVRSNAGFFCYRNNCNAMKHCLCFWSYISALHVFVVL